MAISHDQVMHEEPNMVIRTVSEISQRNKKVRTVALVAHDNKKPDLMEWAQAHREILVNHKLVATGTTGAQLNELGFEVRRFLSGPLGGDQQLGAAIAQGEIDLLVFFWDPLEPQPHDPDVKALLRIATLWNVGIAMNRTSADLLISSDRFDGDHNVNRPKLVANVR